MPNNLWVYDYGTDRCRGPASYEQIERFKKTGRLDINYHGNKAQRVELRFREPSTSVFKGSEPTYPPPAPPLTK